MPGRIQDCIPARANLLDGEVYVATFGGVKHRHDYPQPGVFNGTGGLPAADYFSDRNFTGSVNFTNVPAGTLDLA
jgi:hypothetical protein